MTIKEANNQINKIDNEIEYYLKKKELEISKIMPQATKYDKTLVDGGKREDKYANYVIKNDLLDKELDKLYAEKRILEDFVENELIRLKKYDELMQLIVYYKEQCLEKYTWLQISQKVHYSVIQCKRIYKKWKGQRSINDDTI